MHDKYEVHKKTYVAQLKRTMQEIVEIDIEDNSLNQPSSAKKPASTMFNANWQLQADLLVTNALVESALPIRIVERPAFKKMVGSAACPNLYDACQAKRLENE